MDDSTLKIRRIVFIAPPFRGSLDIAKALIVGEKSGFLSDREDFRKLARSFPSVYQLIPSFDKALVGSVKNEPLDPFKIKNWQQNVTQPGTGFQESLLRSGEAFVRADSAQFGGSSNAPMLNEETFVDYYGEDSLILLGTGHETMWQVPVITGNQGNPNWFDFDNAKRDCLGNGRVHLKSAAIKGVTLAAIDTDDSHGTVCRDETIIKATKMWLKDGKILRIKRRTASDPVNRPRNDYFCKWDGDEASLSVHRHTP